MGCSYLSKPITDKVSADEQNDKLNCGSSSMQGWRESQEDSHNVILEYDKNIAMFAVYDGHGGHEVAQYCSENLPEYIKNTDAYKSGDYKKALVDAFLGFDATIISAKVLKVLKKMADEKKDDMYDDSDDEVEENVSNLYEEATMPIEQVIEKYAANIANLANANLKHLQKEDAEKASNSSGADTSSSSSTIASSSNNAECVNDSVSSTSNTSVDVNNINHIQDESVTEYPSTCTKTENGVLPIPEIKIDSPDSSSSKEKEVITSSKGDEEVKSSADQSIQNGEITTPDENKGDVTSSSAVVENGEVTKKGKGKALAKTKGVKTPNVNERLKRKASQLYKTLLEFEESDESEDDEEDETFEGPNDDSSGEDCDDGVNAGVEEDDSESSAADDDDEEEEEEEEEDEDHCLERNDDDEDGDIHMQYSPGYNSGCTAVVALLDGAKLYVANAGDSRCIISRSGKAVEMSLDHNPSVKKETNRVKKAGGYINLGRINGGLNLSRAIGDHCYKQNKKLSDREQVIIALPDVRTLTINPAKDEFMVLACDGIWNFMSSQEVVDFVLPRIKEGHLKLSQICEEMFDHCLAPNTLGDGTGCDNMTAIIVQFKSTLLKRSSTDETEEPQTTKREKTDHTVES